MPRRRSPDEPRYYPSELRGKVLRADQAPPGSRVVVMPCNGSRFRAKIVRVEETLQRGNSRVRLLRPGARGSSFIGGGTAVLPLERQ